MGNKAVKGSQRFQPNITADENASELVKWIASKMAEKGLHQLSLAEQSGVHQTTIGKILQGKTNPSIRVLGRLFKVLGQPPKSIKWFE